MVLKAITFTTVLVPISFFVPPWLLKNTTHSIPSILNPRPPKSFFWSLFVPFYLIPLSLLTVLPEIIMYLNLDVRCGYYFAAVFQNLFFFF